MGKLVRTRWSRLKKDVEGRFAMSIAGRVSLFMTGYRNTRNEAGRWAIRIDGVEVGGTGDFNAWKDDSASDNPHSSSEKGVCETQSREAHDRNAVLDSLRGFLNLGIEEALTSSDCLIRALAILDRRTGKARLRALRVAVPATMLEARCLAFRCEAEGLGC